MLIDAGERDKSDDVAQYLKGEGITSLDYVVATHPHADHIGGISDILKTFPIGQFLDSGYPHTSGTYEYMLNTINNENIPFKTVKRGDTIDFAPGINVQVLSPGSTYFTDDLNQNSIVLKVTDGSVSFLLMGDAGVEAENAIMQDGYNVNADILKVGHHGSYTSSGQAFIDLANPAVSIIEVGANNEYGHPHTETLQTLQKVSTVYRTDQDGTVTVTTDGSSYSVSTENTASNPKETVHPVIPTADFSTSATSGYTPLTIQFTDVSQNAASRSWNFNSDGTSDSSEVSPVYTYTAPGTYLATLVVSNANGTNSKTTSITVLEENNSNGGSSDSSSDSSSSDSSSSDSSNSGGSSHSSGSGGGSPEPQSNVEIKELSQTFVNSGKPVMFDFPRNATSVLYVSFDSKKNAGKTTTIVEMLKGKSTLVSGLPPGEVYKYLNIWVGNGGFATSKNIENAVVCFKVEKAWLQSISIDQSSIILNMYNDTRWDQLQTSQSGEDDTYLYFTAKTQGFSPFAITGKAKVKEAVNEIESKPKIGSLEQKSESTATSVEQTPEQEENTSTPGFGIIYGMIGLLVVFLSRRR